MSILCKSHFTAERIGIYKQVFVDNFYSIFCYLRSDILVIEFDLLHLRRRSSVTAICNTVSTEIIIRRTLTEITAVCLELFSVTVFFINGLVNVIPDETTLIFRFCVSKICIFMHCATGISHCMSVLAADKRLAVIFC